MLISPISKKKANTFLHPVVLHRLHVYTRIMHKTLKNKQINVRMDDSMAKELKSHAEQNLTTPSQIIRKAIDEYIKKWKRRS